jgi:hypothetical protein
LSRHLGVSRINQQGLATEQTDCPPPPQLHQPGYAQVLSAHMAALAAVDAHRHASAAPTEPHAVSAYLLRREYAHWQQLHARAEEPMATSPTVMRRTSYLATLIGPLPRATARDALTRVALADTVSAADQIIDDHRTAPKLLSCVATWPTWQHEHPGRARHRRHRAVEQGVIGLGDAVDLVGPADP